MQKVIIGLLIISMTLFGGNTLINVTGRASLNALHEAFDASGAELLEVTMNAWGSLSLKSLNEEQLKQTLRTGIHAAFNTMPTSFKTINEEGFVMVQTEVTTNGYLVDASAQSLMSQGKAESYIVVTVFRQSDVAKLDETRQKIVRLFNATGSRPEMTTCLVGSLSGQLSPAEAAMVVGRVLSVLRGEMHESYSDAYVTTLSGFSRRLPGGVVIGGRKANIDLTLRYNPETDKTVLWLAWPTFTLSV